MVSETDRGRLRKGRPAAKIKLQDRADEMPSAAEQATRMREAKFQIGQVVRHRYYPFRGVIFDVDPVFANTEEWWQAIPEEVRPRKDQPFYHLLAENENTSYVAYVSEQNLLPDDTGRPVRHPQVKELFGALRDGQYEARFMHAH